MARGRRSAISLGALGLILAPLVTVGCIRTSHVLVSVPRPGVLPEDRNVVAVVSLPERRPRGARKHSGLACAEKQLATSLVSELLESGHFTTREPRPATGQRWDLRSALTHARLAGADRALLYTLNHIDVRRSIHHVHRYHDASASAEAMLVDVASGRVIHHASERDFVSARVRYSSAAAVRDLLLLRLGKRLGRELLYRSTGRIVELADPETGTLREGIELARRGEWRHAIDAWRTRVDQAPGGAYLNVGIAHDVLGDRDAARENLRRARQSASPYRRLARALVPQS